MNTIEGREEGIKLLPGLFLNTRQIPPGGIYWDTGMNRLGKVGGCKVDD